MKIPNAGNNTASRYPTTAARPTAPKRTTKTGVKQHSAATIVPITPTFRRVLGDLSSELMNFPILFLPNIGSGGELLA